MLDCSRGLRQIDLPRLRLHPLTGELQRHYPVAVSAKRRVTFRFENGKVIDVDYVEYHWERPTCRCTIPPIPAES